SQVWSVGLWGYFLKLECFSETGQPLAALLTPPPAKSLETIHCFYMLCENGSGDAKRRRRRLGAQHAGPLPVVFTCPAYSPSGLRRERSASTSFGSRRP